MKTHLLKQKSQKAANVLIVTLIVTALVGFTLASYLTLVKSQNLTTMRSQAWNATIPVIEAGIEEALAHLNENGTNRLDIDGWTRNGNVYWMRRSFGTDFYFVTITNWFGPLSGRPLIESRGYVQRPVQVVSRSDILLATIGNTSSSSPGYLVRGVRVVARRDALFAKGMVAKGKIDMNGNDVDTDSFDSTDPNASTGGHYDVTKHKDNGHIATNLGLTNSVLVGNANVRGRVSTGPGGSISVGSNGSVGSAAWHDAGNTGIQPGSTSDDMNVDFPDVDTPSSGGWTPGPGLVNGTNYNYVLGDGNYIMSSLTMKGSAKMIATGDAILYVPGNISVSGNAFIVVAPDASLQIYCAGASASIGGNGVFNLGGFATNFAYYGLPSNTAVDFGGNGEFIGTIYAPNADFTLNGGGANGIDFVGASISKTVTMNGKFNFHYDEALDKYGPTGRFVITTWNEMSPNEVTDMSFLSSLLPEGDVSLWY
jgi:hypothetical protein